MKATCAKPASPLAGNAFSQNQSGKLGKSAAEANTERGKNGIIHAMNNRAKTALSLALAIVGGIAAGMRCDASEWVDNSSQTNPRPAAYTVKHIQKGLTLLMLK